MSRKQSQGDPDEQLERLRERLEDLDPAEIVKFGTIFNKYTSRAYTWELWAAAYLIGGACSDTFGPPPSRVIRIVAAPPVEAPPPIRMARMGCALPLFAGTDRPESSTAVQGVTSGRSEEHGLIYKVGARDAVLVLEQHDVRQPGGGGSTHRTFFNLVGCSLSRSPYANYCLWESREEQTCRRHTTRRASSHSDPQSVQTRSRSVRQVRRAAPNYQCVSAGRIRSPPAELTREWDQSFGIAQFVRFMRDCPSRESMIFFRFLRSNPFCKPQSRLRYLA